MRAAIQDADVLAALSPLDVATYLRARGWTLSKTANSFWRYAFAPAGGGRSEVEVPRSSDFEDLPLRMAELLSTLARVERRSQLEVLRDLAVAASDVVRVRLMGADLADGSVSLTDGTELIQRTHDLMLFAACATSHPRAYFGPRKPREATEFVGKLRLGQTEQGSFVISVLSPVSPELSPREAGLLFSDGSDVPFERRVTETLMKATRAAADAAVDAGASGDLAPFDHAVQAGASANLCDALASMLNDKAYSALELSVSWSRNRSTPKGLGAPIRVNREVAPLFESAARELKARAPREDFELEGYIVRLDSEDAVHQGGSIVVVGDVDDGTRRVKISLDAVDYQRAVDAHRRTARVSCAGRLTKDGRQYELKEPKDFTVLGDE
jgi:hypothetical protein